MSIRSRRWRANNETTLCLKFIEVVDVDRQRVVFGPVSPVGRKAQHRELGVDPRVVRVAEVGLYRERYVRHDVVVVDGGEAADGGVAALDERGDRAVGVRGPAAEDARRVGAGGPEDLHLGEGRARDLRDAADDEALAVADREVAAADVEAAGRTTGAPGRAGVTWTRVIPTKTQSRRVIMSRTASRATAGEWSESSAFW